MAVLQRMLLCPYHYTDQTSLEKRYASKLRGRADLVRVDSSYEHLMYRAAFMHVMRDVLRQLMLNEDGVDPSFASMSAL